jgi:hypothetical protein
VGFESFYKMGPVFEHLTLLLYYSKLIVKNSHLQILKTYLLFLFLHSDQIVLFLSNICSSLSKSEGIFKSTV